MHKHPILENTTVLEALKKFYPMSSHRNLEIWIKSGRVFIGEKKVEKKNLGLSPGDFLIIKDKKRPSYKGIKYLYEDRWMIVIEKPASLLSVSSDNPDEENALSFVRDDFLSDTIYPVHRLDRECSGVLLFARGKASQERFDALFEAHDLQREYIAIVDGYLPQKKGTWKSYLIEKENLSVYTTTEDKGKLAVTHFEVVRHSNKFTYLRLVLETGRKHQIRVHCKEAGVPILGDKRYKCPSNPAKRLCLHSLSLSFIHPFTQKEVSFFSQPPKAFQNLGFIL
jgi:23S rRNA pseudouridine1911/1915/1917 synthase